MPHLIRRQILELRDRGAEPDVLVNLTNDGWFWGSSELDLHLRLRRLSLRRMSQAAVDRGEHRLFGLHRFRRADRRAGQAADGRAA